MLSELAELLLVSERTVAVTGAGMSTGSGIPDFRSRDGLWRDHDPFRTSHIGAFNEDPQAFWRFWRGRYVAMAGAIPNAAHRALAELEHGGHLEAVITQNVDGLHQHAGSREVLEMHGSGSRLRCSVCSHRIAADRKVWEGEAVPRCDRCGWDAPLRPDVVLFGEELDWELTVRAQELAERAQLLLVLGSSMEVPPVGNLPNLTLKEANRLVIISREPTRWDGQATIAVRADLTEMLPALALALRAA